MGGRSLQKFSQFGRSQQGQTLLWFLYHPADDVKGKKAKEGPERVVPSITLDSDLQKEKASLHCFREIRIR